jgi:hypothetical protein
MLGARTVGLAGPLAPLEGSSPICARSGVSAKPAVCGFNVRRETVSTQSTMSPPCWMNVPPEPLRGRFPLLAEAESSASSRRIAA